MRKINLSLNRLNLRGGLILINTVFLLIPFLGVSQTISTIAGNGVAGYSGDSGPATSAEIHAPNDAIVDDSGNVYIADFTNNVVRKVNSNGIITTIAGNGTKGYSGDGGPATAAEFDEVNAIALDSAFNLYISDGWYSLIRKVTVSTGIITTVVGNGHWGFSGDGGTATAAELYTPEGVYIDKRHNDMYIADEQNNRIRKVDMVTWIITTVVGNGFGAPLSGGFSGDGGPATDAELYLPGAAKTDFSGNLYIPDALNNRIRKVEAISGIITTIAGTGFGGFSGDGGSAGLAELHWPSDISLDTVGNLFIADGKNNRIRKIDSATGIITSLAGNGVAGYSGDGGPAIFAELKIASSVEFDKKGNYYIADYSNNRIREVKPCPPFAPINKTLPSDTIICAGNSVNLNILGTGKIGWYSSGLGGIYLGSGSSFTTGSIK